MVSLWTMPLQCQFTIQRRMPRFNTTKLLYWFSGFSLAVGYWTIFLKARLESQKRINLDFDLVFQNKTFLLCKISSNSCYVKLNCAPNRVKIIVYFLKYMDFALIRSIFLVFWNMMISRVFSRIYTHKKV